MMHYAAVQIEVGQVIIPAQHLPHLRRKYLEFAFSLPFPNAYQPIKDVSDTFVPLIFHCEGEKKFAESLVTVR